MSSERAIIGADQIRRNYFGSAGRAKAPVSAAGDLTPSARYIVVQAKKKIGQRIACAAAAQPDEEELLKLVQNIEAAEGEELSGRERTAVVASLSAALDHFDILTPLVENAEVNDVIVRAYNDISIQIGRRNIQTDLRFAGKDAYKAFVENLLKRAGKACTLSTPVVDAALTQNIRACVTHESFSPAGSGAPC